MNIKSGDLLYFSFHEGFTERLLSGDFRFNDSGEIEYKIKHFPSGDDQGVFSPSIPLAEKVLELACSDDLKLLSEKYCGGWDDAGGSYFEFRCGGEIRAVRINEIIKREGLEENIEKILFEINDEFIKLASTLVSYNKPINKDAKKRRLL